MGCHTDGSLCSTFSFGSANSNSHCGSRVPSSADRAKLHIFSAYPTVDQGNVDLASRNAVMYPSTVTQTTSSMSYTSPSSAGAAGGAECGKESIPYACGFASSSVLYFDYRPNELSFEEMDSDTWFCYVWDMGSNGGTVGTPCYYLRSETRSTTAGTDPVTGDPTPASESGGTTCVPCTSFSCTPTGSIASYDSPTGDETGDADCPYPTVYAFGTTSV